MGELTSTLGGRIVDSGLAAALITGIVVMAMVTTRQPSRRRALARAGVLGALLAIPIVCLRPFSPLDVAGPIRMALQPTLAWIGTSVGLRPHSSLFGGWRLSPSVWGLVPVVLLVGYLLGVSVGLARFVLGCWGAGWIGRNSVSPGDEAIALYHTIDLAPGRPRPKLRVSSKTTRPVLLGSFRATILIPVGFDLPGSSEALRLSLLHELAHFEASDPWFGLASELATIFWFPLPTLWWMRKQMRLDQEFLADRHASARFGEPGRYAHSLVEIAAAPKSETSLSASRPRRWNGAGSALFQRVLMLVRCPFPVEGRPPRWWRWSLVGSTTLLLLIVTRLTVQATTAPLPDVPEPQSFSMRTLVFEESPTAPTPTIVPIRLPSSFELTFQVYANAAELAQISVFGHPLARAPLAENPLLQDPSRWHKVRLRRVERVLTFALDSDNPRPLPGDSLEEWLSLRSVPGRRTTFRSIHLTW